MADNTLAAILSGQDPQASLVAQTLQDQNQLNLANDNSQWGNQQGPFQALARAISAIGGATGRASDLAALTANRQQARSDYAAAHPEMPDLAQSLALGQSPEQAAQTSLIGQQAQVLRNRAAMLQNIPGAQNAWSAMTPGAGASSPSGPQSGAPATAAPTSTAAPSASPAVLAPVLKIAQARNLSPTATTALVGAGLGEGGFNDPWSPSTVPDESSPSGTEQSFGPWQLHAGGELDGYLKGGGKPGDVDAQTNFVLDRLEQIHPGFSQISDPAAAAAAIKQFENGKQGPEAYLSRFPAAQSLIGSFMGAGPQAAVPSSNAAAPRYRLE
jgi:hypothetical protein